MNVISAETKEKTENRPELYNLAALQMDANDMIGLTAAETLEIAQKLYEKKLITYPRTDSRYISDDLIPDVKKFIKLISESGKYSDRAKTLLDKGLNLDSRIVDNTKSAIITLYFLHLTLRRIYLFQRMRARCSIL